MFYYNTKNKLLSRYKKGTNSFDLKPFSQGYVLATKVQILLVTLTFITTFLLTTITIPDYDTPSRSGWLVATILYFLVIGIANSITLGLVRSKLFDKKRTIANIVTSYLTIFGILTNVIYHLCYSESRYRIASACEFLRVDIKLIEDNFSKELKKEINDSKDLQVRLLDENDLLSIFRSLNTIHESYLTKTNDDKLAKARLMNLRDIDFFIEQRHKVSYLSLLFECQSNYI